MAKKLVYAGYAPVEVTDEGADFITALDENKKRFELAMGNMITCLNHGWAVKLERQDDIVRAVASNTGDIYGDGSQVFVSAEGENPVSAIHCLFWKLEQASNWKPAKPELVKFEGRKFR